ncbi:MAG: hypothetical protein M1834_006351 [Cirrosporium novae-zelandiae]|nr:MAG: hypothetical protein M1834_006351 [Cirrosporium novae-zelandiae]
MMDEESEKSHEDPIVPFVYNYKLPTIGKPKQLGEKVLELDPVISTLEMDHMSITNSPTLVIGNNSGSSPITPYDCPCPAHYDQLLQVQHRLLCIEILNAWYIFFHLICTLIICIEDVKFMFNFRERCMHTLMLTMISALGCCISYLWVDLWLMEGGGY